MRDQASSGESNPQTDPSGDEESKSVRPTSAGGGNGKKLSDEAGGRIPGIQGESDPKTVLSWLQEQGTVPGASPSALLTTPTVAAPIAAARISVPLANRAVRSAIAAVGTMMGFKEPTAGISADGAIESSVEAEPQGLLPDTVGADASPTAKAMPAEADALALAANALPVAEASAARPAGLQDAATGASLVSSVLGAAPITSLSAALHPIVASQAGAWSNAADATELPSRLGEQVQWLVDGGGSEARLLLHPAALGAINVQVRIEDHGASVWFSAEHPAARAALEAALPQLRERFASEGVVLDRTRVTADSGNASFGDARQQSGTGSFSGHSGSRGTGGLDEDGESEGSRIPVPPRVVHLGLLDRYA